ncbi:MAG: YciI family protein [Alphaproteobacteria bacterium]
MKFIFNGFDKPNSDDIRVKYLDEHITFLGTAKDNNIEILLGGPVLDDNGNQAGSTIIIEAENKQLAQDWLQQDPYYTQGLFGQTTLFAIDVVINNF